MSIMALPTTLKNKIAGGGPRRPSEIEREQAEGRAPSTEQASEDGSSALSPVENASHGTVDLAEVALGSLPSKGLPAGAPSSPLQDLLSQAIDLLRGSDMHFIQAVHFTIAVTFTFIGACVFAGSRDETKSAAAAVKYTAMSDSLLILMDRPSGVQCLLLCACF
ncbi:unnamed protein product [Amoebophrya sp. A25]|nr:unnamed protein product [Amoebophrya sp. A25]|eukprot:GSA25T00015162001.1